MGRVGSGDHKYRLIEDWGDFPHGWFLEQTSIATDSRDRVYLFNRGDHPIMVLDRDGRYLTCWGEGLFKSAHGLFIDKEDALYLPNFHRHAVMKMSVDGDLLMTFGILDSASDPRWSGDVRSAISKPVARAYGPFTCPTDVAVDEAGNVFCSDGYGNARVHRFSKEGALSRSWGEPGTAPGQFHVPHGLWVHTDGRVFVADRENNRVQIFTSDGDLIDVWGGFDHPCDIFIDRDDTVFVAEGAASEASPIPADPNSLIQLRSIDGEMITSWTGPGAGGGHSVWCDSSGDIYLNQNQPGQRLLKYERLL